VWNNPGLSPLAGNVTADWSAHASISLEVSTTSSPHAGLVQEPRSKKPELFLFLRDPTIMKKPGAKSRGAKSLVCFAPRYHGCDTGIFDLAIPNY
jgi:hypothetical protein